MSVRSGAKALIVREGRILLNRCRHADGRVYYDLPGGGQKQHEPLEEAVVREVLEETGLRVHVLRFAALSEEIYADPELQRRYPDYSHRMLHIFLAEVVSEEASPTEKDYCMEGSEWVPLEVVKELPELCPRALKTRLAEVLSGEGAVFLGTEINEWSEV